MSSEERSRTAAAASESAAAKSPRERADIDIVPVADGAPTLSLVKIDNFGVLRHRQIGPFCPGFNVVYGPNEVGKTTIAAFIAGILFGWDGLRGHRDGYRPLRGQRSGSLVFRTEAEGSVARTFELKRDGNGGLSPASSPIVADIDRATFRTLFSLTSDELRGLRSSTELVARLLNVEVGTATSPMKALATLRESIARATDETSPTSLPSLVRERARVRAQLQEARDGRLELMRALGELTTLQEEIADLTAQERATTTLCAQLEKAAATLATIDASIAETTAECERQRSQEAEARTRRAQLTEEIGETLAAMTGRDDRTVRLQISELEEESLRLAASEEMASHHLTESRATLAMIEDAGDEVAERGNATEAGSNDAAVRSTSGGGAANEDGAITGATADGKVDREAFRESRAPIPATPTRPTFPRTLQLAVSGGIFAVLVLIGVPLFLYGRSVGSLSIWVLGFGLVALAVLMAASTLVLAFRPLKTPTAPREEAAAARRRDAQWIVRQDEQRLAALRKQRATFDQSVRETLTARGLAEAEGSLRRARQLLDDARDIRAEIAQESQREQASASRIAEGERELEALRARRSALLAEGELPETADAETLAEELDHRRGQAEALRASLQSLEARRAALNESIEAAARDRSFDELKLRNQELRTCIDDRGEELSRLLLARRQLETAIATWGSRNQPGVYAQASEYLSLMTGGHWTAILMRADGRLLVRDDAGVTWEPSQLSLGSVQQLYLAIRLALLQEARSVGRSIPVLADDILVHFDRTRQEAALQALGMLAETRQVILFTCHEELRTLATRVLEDAPCDLRVIDL